MSSPRNVGDYGSPYISNEALFKSMRTQRAMAKFVKAFDKPPCHPLTICSHPPCLPRAQNPPDKSFNLRDSFIVPKAKDSFLARFSNKDSSVFGPLVAIEIKKTAEQVRKVIRENGRSRGPKPSPKVDRSDLANSIIRL